MNTAFFYTNRNKYIYVFADCMFVKGISRTSICDISRKRIFFISNSYYELTTYFRHKKIGEITELLDGKKSLLQFYKFLIFLLEEHIATITDNIDHLPEPDIYWDNPSDIVSAIIDIRDIPSYLPKVFNELYLLRCQYLQLRFYKETTLNTLKKIVALIKGKCFKDVEFLLKYTPAISLEDLQRLSSVQRNIRFLIHSTPSNACNNNCSEVTYTEQTITSCNHCGIINQYALHISSMQGFMENKLYNSCLNRKIAVDENGYIKNCPSMKKDYGHISQISLVAVVKKNSFKRLWHINKDCIKTCNNCEFRYICSDCRAYTEGNNLFEKPLKCSYDPYTAKWENELLIV